MTSNSFPALSRFTSPTLARVATSSTVASGTSYFSGISQSTAATSVAESRLELGSPRTVLKNVASFDGGGVKGVFHSMVMEQLQLYLDDVCVARGLPRVQVQDVFNEYIGTSAGGLTSVLLGVLGVSPTTAVWSFLKLSKKIFRQTSTVPRWLKMAPWVYFQNRCSSSQVHAELAELVESLGLNPDMLLAECAGATDVTVVAVDSQDADEVVLLSNRSDCAHPDIPLLKAAMATIAAPTFFKPVQHNGHSFIDGAFKANNPSPHARTPARETNLLLSIGTGARKIELPSRPTFLGGLHTVKALAHKVASTKDADRETRRVFEALGREDRYIRIQPPPELASAKINDWKAVPGLMIRYRTFLQTADVAAKLLRAAELIVDGMQSKERA